MTTLDELAAFINATNATVNVQLIYDLNVEPEPAPADPGDPGDPPPDPNLNYYRIDASSKKSQQVKVRKTPSPSSDGPTIKDGERVAGTGRGQKNNDVFFLEIVTLDDFPLRGWVEDFYLIPD